ncbi:hypothetical protein AAHC03_016446 [Spirometra sp. Aus1]
MSGYALLEVAGEVERMRIVENLWQRTSGFLVLIEEGTKAGFAALLEARDRLIKKGGEEMHIFAPCPHRLQCGKAGMTCSSSVKYYQLGLTKDEAYPSVEKFSYLVVSRGDWRRFASPDEESEPTLPRIVSTLPNSRAPALDVDLCLPSGDCERVTFSRTGTDRSLFFFLKNSTPGKFKRESQGTGLGTRHLADFGEYGADPAQAGVGHSAFARQILHLCPGGGP